MDREYKIIKTSVIGIIVNLILVIFKATIGVLVNSVAIILDAVNNFSDALSSIITIIGTKLAGKPADKNHPYGYGRIEYFSSIIIAIIVLIAGITALQESFPKIFTPDITNYDVVSLIIIAVAVIVKFILGRYVKRVGEDINSQSLIASGSDALFDSILSLSTLIAAIIHVIYGISLEGILGVIISFVIIKASIEMISETVNQILGSRIDSDFASKIKNHINSFDKVKGTYDLVLHNYGPEHLVGSVHIEVDDNLTAKDIHELTYDISTDIYRKFGITLTIGIYATNTDTEISMEVKEKLVEIVNKYDDVLELHGFYFDYEKNVVTFDLVIDFDCNREEVLNSVVDEISKQYPEYKFYSILDDDISD